MKQRKKIVPLAEGRVLEVGIGSGLNLPFYDPSKVKIIWGLEPCEKMRGLAREKANKTKLDVRFIAQSCENIQLDNNSIDTVLITYTLCTIPDAIQALFEIRNILKPEGKLLFCEHGMAPDRNILNWQNRINPVWKRIGGGCNLNRSIPHILESGGFKINQLEAEYINNFKIASFNYWGVAVKRCQAG